MRTTKDQLRMASNYKENIPSGIDLINKISDKGIQKAPDKYLQSVRTHVIDGCDELIDIGARIRPLVVDGAQIGWVRGVHNSEKRRLSRWVFDSNDFISSVLTLATSLKKEEIDKFTLLEIRNLIELVQEMTDYDVSLYPYLGAFVSTLPSENLWHGRGLAVSSFENRDVVMPDGKVMRILMPSDHARLWATLCMYREQAKARLDANWNAVLQVRPMAGKSVDPLANELKALGRRLATDSLEAWEEIVKVKPETNLDDGWAHVSNIDTQEGMLKELYGMVKGDKHEQVMEKFEKDLIAKAESRQKELETIIERRGGPGIGDESITIESDVDVRQRERDLKKGKPTPIPVDRNRIETTYSPADKIKKYQR